MLYNNKIIGIKNYLLLLFSVCLCNHMSSVKKYNLCMPPDMLILISLKKK